MAYETKVILTLLSQQALRASSVEEVYDAIAQAASVEGFKLPSYEEGLKNLSKLKNKNNDNNQ